MLTLLSRLKVTDLGKIATEIKAVSRNVAFPTFFISLSLFIE